MQRQWYRLQQGEIWICTRAHRFRRLRDNQGRIQASPKNFRSDRELSNTKKYHRRQIVVRLVNQLAYTFAQAPVMEPFRSLLSSKSFFWDQKMDGIFLKSKTDGDCQDSERWRHNVCDQPVLSLTCQSQELAFIWDRSIVSAHPTPHLTVEKTIGNLFSPDCDLQQIQIADTLLSKGRHSPQYMDFNGAECLSWEPLT